MKGEEENLTAYIAAFDPQQRARIEAISLDMWPAHSYQCLQGTGAGG